MYRIPKYRINLIREATVSFESKRFSNSRDVFKTFREEMLTYDREHFLAVMLDSKNNIIGVNDVSVGSLSTSVVHPREVYKAAIAVNAAAIMFLHNHPSGDCAPSREDRECTQRLYEAGKILGIRVLDHLVVGENDYFSFADAGILEQTGQLSF